MSELSGNDLFSVTSELAPKIEFFPIFAWFITMLPMPTIEFSPI